MHEVTAETGGGEYSAVFADAAEAVRLVRFLSRQGVKSLAVDGERMGTQAAIARLSPRQEDERQLTLF